MAKSQVLIIGGSSGIARALIKQLMETQQVIVISRQAKPTTLNSNNLSWQQIADYSEEKIITSVAFLREFSSNINQVYICNGVLHNQHLMPEKRLTQFTEQAFLSIITSNTLVPMLWLKHLTQDLLQKQVCKIVVFSARVGSISDNQLGGWYSYRASKAALNMLLKSAAIELARRAKKLKIIIFHPGTTDTSLSKPFQKNVPEGKLFTPDFVATQLINIVAEAEIDGQASYLDWQGEPIDW